MKMSSDKLLKAFATQQEREASNHTGSLYFKGSKLFSYGEHYLAAEINAKLKRAVINCKHYSATTRKHTNMAYDVLDAHGYEIKELSL
jgi:hypothetical protein